MEIKEMTLNEILDSIFEGKLEMEEFNKQFEAFCYEKGMEMLTKQFKRPQYTFQEALKAFEEGKEIESCESERGFKSKDNDSVYILMEHEICDRVYNGFRLFSHDEVKGKWYIND